MSTQWGPEFSSDQPLSQAPQYQPAPQSGGAQGPIAYGAPSSNAGSVQTSSIILLVLSGLSFFCCGGVLSIIPAILAIIALVQEGTNPDSARKLNKIGWIIFVVIIVLVLALIALYFILVMAGVVLEW